MVEAHEDLAERTSQRSLEYALLSQFAERVNPSVDAIIRGWALSHGHVLPHEVGQEYHDAAFQCMPDIIRYVAGHAEEVFPRGRLGRKRGPIKRAAVVAVCRRFLGGRYDEGAVNNILLAFLELGLPKINILRRLIMALKKKFLMWVGI